MLAGTKVWLPEGRWTDFFTGRIYRGGQWVTMYRDLDAIPVLAREGSIVPMYRSAYTNNLSLLQPLDIHIWRGNGSFILYEDDGSSTAYKQGKSAVIAMDVMEKNNTVTYTIHKPEGDASVLPAQREIHLCFRDIKNAIVETNEQCFIMEDSNGIIVPITYTNDTVIITLKEVKGTENERKDILRSDFMTRVQGGNGWKASVFPSWKNGFSNAKIPNNIKKAMAEFDALF